MSWRTCEREYDILEFDDTSILLLCPRLGSGEIVSFYSALVLAANAGSEAPSSDAVLSLCQELGLVDPKRANFEFGNLADDIINLFADPAANAMNERFFSPDSVSFATAVDIQTPEGDFEGPGWCIRIHGYGYFYPWEPAEIRARAIQSPKLLRLREAVAERFGGCFVMPAADEPLLRERSVDGDEGWVWFFSESL
jgi:hypothetical protein